MWEDITNDWVNHKAYLRLAKKAKSAKNPSYRNCGDYEEIITTHFGRTYKIGWTELGVYFIEQWCN